VGVGVGVGGDWNWGVPTWFSPDGHDPLSSLIFYAILIAVLVEIKSITLFFLSVLNKQTTISTELYTSDLNLLFIRSHHPQ
jgi:hypothetical protein